MVVDNDILVLGEKCVEIIGAQSMRVAAMGPENHEVGNVDDAHSQSGNHLAKECSSRYNFECHFDTDTNEDAGYLKSAQVPPLQKEDAHTSGFKPSSTLANFHIDEPATQCCLTLSEI